MNMHCVPICNVYVFQSGFLGEEMKVKLNVRLGVRFSQIVHLLRFSGCYFTSIIMITSLLHTEILCYKSLFNLTSEYFDYILKKEISRYKLNWNPTEDSEG
jgi:hypothetical protein